MTAQTAENPAGGLFPVNAGLRLLTGPKRGMEFSLSAASTKVGRASDGVSIDLSESDPDANEISREHAIFQWVGRKLQLVDLGSTNGTFLNGSRVASLEANKPSKPCDLMPNDRIIFACVEAEIIIRS